MQPGTRTAEVTSARQLVLECGVLCLYGTYERIFRRCRVSRNNPVGFAHDGRLNPVGFEHDDRLSLICR